MSQNYFYPPSGGAGSNASVGTTGTAAPGSATLVGGRDAGGILRPILVATDGTQAVSVASLPLPTGAATEATLSAINSKTPALGQATMAGSRPVVIASDQSPLNVQGYTIFASGSGAALNADILPSTDVSNYENVSVQITGTFTATITFQGSNDNTNFVSVAASLVSSLTAAPVQTVTAPALYSVPVLFRYLRVRVTAYTSGTAVGTLVISSLAAADLSVKTVRVTDSGGANITVGQKVMATSVPVVIASDQSAIPTTVASLPLPTGAATEATLAALSAKIPALGQALMASSQPVVIASDQTPLTVEGYTTYASGSASALNADLIASTDVSMFENVSVQITGAFSGTVQFQGSNDNSTFLSVLATNFTTVNATAPIVSTTAAGMWNVPVTFRYLRIRFVAYVSGSATATIVISSQAAFDVSTRTTISNIRDTNSASITVGLKTASASLPVVIASDQGAIPTSFPSGVALSNAPIFNNYTTTAVTTGAYVQLVASTTSATKLVEVFDSSGQALIFGVGAAASEVAQFNITPGGNGQVPLAIPAGSRIAIKALTGTANVGYIIVNLYG